MLLGPVNDVYHLTAPRVRRRRESLVLSATAQDPVRIVRREGGLVVREMEAREAAVTVEPGDPDPEPRIVVVLRDARITAARSGDASAAGARVTAARAGASGAGARGTGGRGSGTPAHGTEHSEIQLDRLRWPQPLVQPLSTSSFQDLLPIAKLRGRKVSSIRTAASQFLYAIGKLDRRIRGQFHGRAASSCVALLIMVLGALLSMTLRGGLPLVVYLGSFLMAILTVFIIQSGAKICRDLARPAEVGLAVTWSGNLLLATVVVVIFWRLSRT